MLTYETFKTQLIDELKGLVPCSKELKVSKVLKNNDVYLDSISILDSEASKHLTPVVYLQNYYSKYEKGASVKTIANEVYDILATSDNAPSFELSSIETFDAAKEKITLSVVNYELNQEYLSNVVHRRWLDLAIIYKYNVKLCGDSEGSITITNHLMNIWNINEEDLYDAATDNTGKTQWHIVPIFEVMKEILCENKCESDLDIPELSPNLYVLTSDNREYGASGILFPDVFEKFLRDNRISCDGLYILPSSTEELIIIPANNGDIDPHYLSDMVSEVNETCVEKQQILGYSVYLYDPKAKKVSIIE